VKDWRRQRTRIVAKTTIGAAMPFLREIQLRRDKVADFGVYPFSIPAVRSLETLVFSPGLTCLAGENGSGKSTLIEAIAILAGFNPEGGTKNFSHAYDRTESNLAEFLRPVRNARREKSGFFLRAESMFNLFSEANRLDVWREDAHRMSHGESFLYLVQERFGANSVFVLDEPEAALSPQRQLALLKLIGRHSCGPNRLRPNTRHRHQIQTSTSASAVRTSTALPESKCRITPANWVSRIPFPS
jgi:predicted ATPase